MSAAQSKNSSTEESRGADESGGSEDDSWVRPEIEFTINERDLLVRLERLTKKYQDEYKVEYEDLDLLIPPDYCDLVAEIDLRSARMYLMMLPDAEAVMFDKATKGAAMLPAWIRKLQSTRRTTDVENPMIRSAEGHYWMDLPLSYRDHLLGLERDIRSTIRQKTKMLDGLRQKYGADKKGMGLHEILDSDNGRFYYLTAMEHNDLMIAKANESTYTYADDIRTRMHTPRKNPKKAKKKR